MRIIRLLAAFAALLSVDPCLAQQPTLHEPLLDGLQGDWIATGTIGGEKTTHDITAEWVIGHQYLRFHEVSREREKNGKPKYEAVVHIGWNQKTAKFGIVWLDDFGGLNTQSVGSATKRGEALPFVFTNLDGSFTRTTMSFDPANKMWSWTIDEDSAGKLSRFATLTLTRAH
jgi:hypothetical protein